MSFEWTCGDSTNQKKDGMPLCYKIRKLWAHLERDESQLHIAVGYMCYATPLKSGGRCQAIVIVAVSLGDAVLSRTSSADLSYKRCHDSSNHDRLQLHLSGAAP